jgi:hypothetical protein
MITGAVRGAVTAAALTIVFSLVPASLAHADDDIKKIRLTGIKVADTMPAHVEAGDSWVTYLKLYTTKNRLVGDGSSRCSAVHVSQNGPTVQCTRVLRLKEGDLTLYDMITYGGSAPVTAKSAIVGGARAYNDAEGEGYLTLHRDRILFDLRVDDWGE